MWFPGFKGLCGIALAGWPSFIFLIISWAKLQESEQALMGSDLNGTLGTTLWFFLLIGTFLSLILGLAMRAVNLILPAGILRGSWMYKYGNYMIYSLLSLLSEFILRLLKFFFMPHGFTYTLSLWNNIQLKEFSAFSPKRSKFWCIRCSDSQTASVWISWWVW